MKNALIIASVLSMASVAEARDGYRRDQSIDTGRQLAMTVRQIANEAQNVAEELQYRGRGRPHLWFQIANKADQLAPAIRYNVVRPLRQGAPLHQAKRGLNSLQYEFRRLYSSIDQTRRQPTYFANQVERSKRLLSRLKSTLRGGGGGGGVGRYVGQCEVVLETVWGSDIQKYYATARAFSKHEALSLARRDAMDQCLANRRGALSKCTVNTGRCSAYPVGGGRPGRGGRGGR